MPSLPECRANAIVALEYLLSPGAQKCIRHVEEAERVLAEATKCGYDALEFLANLLTELWMTEALYSAALDSLRQRVGVLLEQATKEG